MEVETAAVIAQTKAVVANNFSKFQLVQMIKSHILTSNKKLILEKNFTTFYFFKLILD